MRLIDPIALKQSIAVAVILKQNKTLEQIIDEQPTVNQWTLCTERLPKEGQDVLFSVGGVYTAEGCLRADGDWAQFRWDTIQPGSRVDAWMPLPEPYGKEK